MTEHDDHDRDTATADSGRVVLAELTLPSGGGTVRFKDPYSLTGRDVRELRRAGGSTANLGEAGNLVLELAMILLVDDWNIDYLPRDARLPRHDRKVIDRLRGEDLVAIEQHVGPVLDIYRPNLGGDNSPGGPYRPVSG